MKVKVHNAEKVKIALNKIDKDARDKIVEKTKEIILWLQGNLPGYPGERPAQDYRRTGLLGRVVTTYPAQPLGAGAQALSKVETLGSDIVGLLGGQLDYIEFVIDEHNQAWMHAGRWYQLQPEVLSHRDEIISMYEQMADELTEDLK